MSEDQNGLMDFSGPKMSANPSPIQCIIQNIRGDMGCIGVYTLIENKIIITVVNVECLYQISKKKKMFFIISFIFKLQYSYRVPWINPK